MRTKKSARSLAAIGAETVDDHPQNTSPAPICQGTDNISTFNGIKPLPIGMTTWQEALEDIRSDKYKKVIARVRVIYRNFGWGSPEYREIKIKLPAVTIGGVFSPHRAMINIIQPTGFIILDLDHLNDKIEVVFNLLTQDENVWFVFRSPSGEGLKVGIRSRGIKCDADHKKLYFAIEKYFKEVYGIEIDTACKDISRLTFVSHDPELWINPEPYYFDISKWSKPLEPPQPVIPSPNFKNSIGKEKYARMVLESCCEEIRQSQPGNQHHTRLRMSRLIGGYLRYIDENEVITALERAVRNSGAKRLSPAMKTVRDGLEYGKLEPITIEDLHRSSAKHSGSISHGQAEPLDDLLDFEIKEKPRLDLTKFSGITKAFVELATRNSEADPAAVVFTFLARFGVEVGRKPYFNIGDTRHHGRLGIVIVGETAKSRKGTSAKPVERLLSLSSLSSPIEYKNAHFSPGPFSSGEGIIYAVRNPVKAWNRKKQTNEIVDPGVDDKRLFVLDEEFGGVLANTKREGNTLSMVFRCAWDSGDFDLLTKNSKISATGAHIGWVSHITQYELLSKLPECEGFNGFCNRILWVYSQRRKLVPMPEPMPTKELAELQYRLLSILNFCHEREREITFDEQAKESWVYEYYQKLSSRPENGLLGVILNRSEAQVRRQALLFALLDGESKVGLKHLDQAMAAWQYCEDSACYIFKGQAQDSVTRKISQALQGKGSLTGTEIRDLFSRHVKKDRIQKAIEELIASDTVEMVSESTGGRPLQVLKQKRTSDKSDKRFENGVSEGLLSHKSLMSLGDSEKKPGEQKFEDLGAGCSDRDEEDL